MIYNDIRRKTKKIKIGRIAIGDNTPIAIQSMTNTDTHDKLATLEQIRALEAAGCDIVRITVPDLEAADTIDPTGFNEESLTDFNNAKEDLKKLFELEFPDKKLLDSATDVLKHLIHNA